MKKILLHATLAVAILFTACKKDDPEPTRTELLTSGSWSLTALVSDEDANGTYEFNDFALFPACLKDNFFTFKTNFELEINEGPSKCDPLDPQTDVLTWSFLSNETVLVIDGDSETIVELTGSTLKLKADNGGGTSSLITFTKR